jgi:hypothetical protein
MLARLLVLVSDDMFTADANRLNLLGQLCSSVLQWLIDSSIWAVVAWCRSDCTPCSVPGCVMFDLAAPSVSDVFCNKELSDLFGYGNHVPSKQHEQLGCGFITCWPSTHLQD